MSKRLALVSALSLVVVACNGGPAGLTAQGTLEVGGTTSGGPFTARFEFPRETVLDGTAGLTAMCTVSRGTVANGAVIDLIVPTSASNPLESVSIMVRGDETSGTVEADVRGSHFANTDCGYEASYVESNGTVQVRTTGACRLTGDTAATIDARLDLVIRGCTVVE